jgi:glucosamine--fructose-6-phosphate aminotransferase (isomerizing)
VIDRVGALRADIARAPDALAALLDAYLGRSSPIDGLDPRVLRGRRVALVGLGSSRYAALDSAHGLREGGLPAWIEYASAEGSPPSKDLVLLAVSASGATPEVVALARRHRGTSLVIGVTNVPASPLAGESDVLLPLLAGPEAAAISTLTYRATVVVLDLLAGRFGLAPPDARDLWATVGRLRDIGEAEEPGVASLISRVADRLDGARAIDVIGPASRIGSISQAALMLREAPRLPAHPHESVDWLHTAVYLALPGHRALLVTGSPADGEVIDTIRRRGGEVVAIGSEIPGAAVSIGTPATHPRLRTIVESALIDRLAVELWERASAPA